MKDKKNIFNLVDMFKKLNFKYDKYILKKKYIYIVDSRLLNIINECDSIINYFKKNILDINNIKKNIINNYYINNFKKNIDILYIYSLINEKDIKINKCYMYIQSGIGGFDSNEWSNILYKNYIKYITKKKFKYTILDESLDKFNNIKYKIVKIEGNFSYGILKFENGIHKLIRKSNFDSFKTHTSFSSIFIFPKMLKQNLIDKNESYYNINTKDIKINFCKSSGSGGQHVNKTESAVKITHIPTNINVKYNNYRSQHRNRKKAVEILNKKINLITKNKINIENKIINKLKANISWNNHTRIYYADNYTIKDIKTGKKYNNANFFLYNYLNDIIKDNLEMNTIEIYE